MTGIKLQAILSVVLTLGGSLPVIDHETLLPIGGVIAGVVLAVRITWIVATKYAHLNSRMNTVETRQKQLDRRQNTSSKGGGGSNP